MSRRRGAVAVWAVLLLFAVTALVFIQRSADHASRGRDRVVIFGDSLTYQAEPYFNLLVQADGKAAVSDFAFGGTAACDWLPKMSPVVVGVLRRCPVLAVRARRNGRSLCAAPSKPNDWTRNLREYEPERPRITAALLAQWASMTKSGNYDRQGSGTAPDTVSRRRQAARVPVSCYTDSANRRVQHS
jgi:hypothetical protein